MQKKFFIGRYLVAALLLGCAPAGEVALRTDAEAYKRLPEQKRTSATAKEDGELIRAQKELDAALQEQESERSSLSASEAERRASEEALASARAQVQTAPPDKQQDAQHELAVASAGVEVQQVKQDWNATRGRWRQSVIEAARRHVATADAAVELARAQALAKSDGAIEVERYRGQYGRLHKLESEALAAVRPARQDLDRAEAALSSAKARYAELKGTVLPAPALPPAPTAPKTSP